MFFPIVDVQTVEHIKAMPEALRIALSREEVAEIQGAAEFQPQFPMSFLFNYNGDQNYHLGLTAADVSQLRLWIQAPPKPLVSSWPACFADHSLTLYSLTDH